MKLIERTDEEATEAIHAGRESRHSEAAFARGSTPQWMLPHWPDVQCSYTFDTSDAGKGAESRVKVRKRHRLNVYNHFPMHDIEYYLLGVRKALASDSFFDCVEVATVLQFN
jgi:hypothetical protein